VTQPHGFAEGGTEEDMARKSARSQQHNDVVEHVAPQVQPVEKLLEPLQRQSEDALKTEFFDEGTTTTTNPVRKRARSETATAEVHAKRRDPKIEATVSIEVRVDREEEGEGGRYQARAQGRVGAEREHESVELEVPLPLDVEKDADRLSLDPGKVRAQIDRAIESTGVARPPRKRR
jgi:hypothetical protein